MALQAKRIDVGDVQQACVGRTVRGMAGDASLGLDHWVLKHKRTRGFGMALGAYRVLIGSRFQLLALERAMRIMAIAASHQPFIYFVMKGLSERRFHLRVAGVAEIGLRNLE